MSFGERIKYRRGELKLSRADLAERLGVSSSAVSNYENGVSFPKEDIMLRLFDSLETEPNILFQDSYRGGGQVMSGPEQALLRQYRGLSPMGRESVRSVVEACAATGTSWRPLSRSSGSRGSFPFTAPLRPQATLPRYSARTLTTSPLRMRCRRRRSLPSASAATPWFLLLRTARWSM